MRVFECALKLVLRKPIYLLIYGVWLSLMGVFMASSLAAATATSEYTPIEPDFAVIDRDGSEISEGICTFLRTQGAQTPLEDAPIAIQDAVAKGTVEYVLIIPDGYGEQLMDRARDGSEAPLMECIYSYYSATGALMDAALMEYTSALEAYAELMPDADQATVLELARKATDADVPVTMVRAEGDAAASDQLVFCLQFDMYVLLTGVTVCVGMMLGALNRADVRRRNLASPLSFLRYSGQTALASIVVMLVFCAFVLTLGIACFPASFTAISPAGKALLILTVIAFALVPLSCAYLLAQLSVSEAMLNAVSNLLGLVLSFLGGSWVPLSLMTPEVEALARFLPGYWYTDALSRAGSMAEPTPAALSAIGCDLGVLLLFAAAIFAVAMVVGRMRTQTAEAGGNAAAEAAAL